MPVLQFARCRPASDEEMDNVGTTVKERPFRAA
jgi:hypothetical protein